MRSRSNFGSANTRAIKKLLGGLVESVSVKSSGYCGGAGTVTVPAGEIEILASARKAVMDSGDFRVTEIKTYKNLNESRFIFDRLVKEAA